MSPPVAARPHPVQNRQVAGILVSAVAPTDPVQLGETFAVALDIAQVDTPLSGFQLDLSYDPSILDFLAATEGAFLDTTDHQVVCPAVAQSPGHVRLACASIGAEDGPTGGGTLATLTFQARIEGESDLTLSNVLLPDGGCPPVLLDATLQDGSVIVGTPLADYQVYLPLVLRDHTAALDRVTPGNPFPGWSGRLQAWTTSGYWADLDDDSDVDADDLRTIAGSWNCTPGQPCYDSAHDRDGDMEPAA